MSIENVPTSTVPIVKDVPASIKKFATGMIQAEDMSTVEDDPDELRDIGVEDIEENIAVYESSLESWSEQTFMESPSAESFEDMKEAVGKMAYSVSRFFDNNQDRAFRIIKVANGLKENVHRYNPEDSVFETKYAQRVHANQSLKIADIIKALKNNVRIGDFVKERYKDLIKEYVDRVVNKTVKHFNQGYFSRVSNMLGYRKAVSRISEDVTSEISVKLEDYFVGPSEKRILAGGYSIQRVPDWKTKFIDIGSFLRFSGVSTINIMRVIKIDHDDYKGDNIVTYPSKQELLTLINMAEEIAKRCIVKHDDVSFSAREYEGLLKDMSQVGGYVDEDPKLMAKFAKWVKESKTKQAVNAQVVSVSALPTRVMDLNLKTADALVYFIAEIMGEAAPQFKDIR